MRKGFLILALVTPSFCLAQDKLITLEDIWRNNTFAVRSVPGFNALKGGESYTESGEKDGLHTLTIKSLKDVNYNKVLYSGKLSFDDYALSDGLDKVLLLTEGKNIYRRSILHKAYVYDAKSGTETMIDEGKVLHPTFSPDGTKVAYVKANNLYYKDLSTGKTIQVTYDGEINKIINGNCDWVYEEEFGFTRAFEWAPDSKHLAYYRFDESNVPEYTMTVYDSLYPTPYKYKYPKAGEPNSIVDIYLYDLATNSKIKADVSGKNGNTDFYIPRIKWTRNPNSLCVFKLNRRQDKLNLLLVNATTGAARSIYKETNKAFVAINDNLLFLPDGSSFLFNSERDGWNHLYIYDWKDDNLTLLTNGDYDVADLVDVDVSTGKVFYTAAEASPMERKLYSVSFSGRNKHCLTPEPGTHAITAIEGAQYFLDRNSTLNVPPVYQLRDAKGKVVRVLEDNHALKAKMAEYRLGKMNFIQVNGANGVKLNAWQILPPDFNANKKYPVLLYQYSGPNSQEVADRFPVRDYFWHHMLAQKGYIVICADGTGTGFRGEAFRKKTYLQLGKYESDDQIALAKYLGSLPYVDKSRIGIWGWSYGGFMSSTCILKGADVFKMAIAVAPVTNWRFYDNIYTERYMRKPIENKEGYDGNAPESMAANLKGKFLLIHGTGDDNVHFQNSVMLVNNLIKAGKDFDSEYYPNRAHGISGGNTRLHLYRRMTDFILENL